MQNQLDQIRDKYHAFLQSVDLEMLNAEELREIKRVERMLNTAYSKDDDRKTGRFFSRLEKSIKRFIYSVVDFMAGRFGGKSEDDINLTSEEKMWIVRAVGEAIGVQPEPAYFASLEGTSQIMDNLEKSDRQSLSLSANQKAVRDISKKVLGILKPSELTVFDDLIDAVMNMTARGRFATVGGIDMPGSLGVQDLMIVIVVPIVAAAVDEMLQRLGHTTVEQIKRRLKKEEEIKAQLEVKVGDIETVIRIIQYPGGKKEIQGLARAVNAALLEYLQNE